MISIHEFKDFEQSTGSQKYLIARQNDTGVATLNVMPRTTVDRIVVMPNRQDSFRSQDRQHTHEILEKFTVTNSERVRFYLASHPSLKPILQQAHDFIHELFNDVEIELKIVSDAEIQDDKTLALYIRAHMDIGEAWERLRQIEDSWYINLPRFIRDKINIDVR